MPTTRNELAGSPLLYFVEKTMGKLILPYDPNSNVIDPFALDLMGHEKGVVGSGPDCLMRPAFYRVIIKASYTFQLGDWRRRRRVAVEKNDFAALDRLDREYEMIGC